jgi:hypothetical protein
MNSKTQNRVHHHWLGWVTLFAFAALLSPINIQIVIAQETPEFAIAPADPGSPPIPPQAPVEPSVQESPVQEPAAQEPAPSAVPATPVEPSPPVEAPAVEPAPASAPAETSDVSITSSEITSDTDFGRLLPKEGATVEATPSDNEKVRTLSVEPSTRPLLPENRPAWVGAEPDFTTTQHYLYVGSLPTQEQLEVDDALDEPLVAAVRNYIDQEVVNQLGAADSMPVTAEFIRRNLIDNLAGYECELTTGQEPLFQKWVTVRITPEQRDLFRQWHTETTQRSRLAPLCVGLVAVLSVISLSHVVLRRFSASSPLAAVNQHLPEQVVSRKTRSSAKGIFFVLLLAAVAFAFLLPLFAVWTVRTSEFEVRKQHDLHKQYQIETLDGHRTVILESKSPR